MLLSEKHPHERDSRIVFYEEGHVYEVNGDRGFISTTTFIHRFFPEFNAVEVIRRMRLSKNWPSSPYNGQTDEQIMKLWNDKKEKAATLGTMMHAFIEDFYNQAGPLDDDRAVRIGREILLFEAFANDFKAYTPYRTEWCVFDEEFKIAGSIDMVFLRDVSDSNRVCIFDWKRVPELKRRNPFQKALPPLSSLDDCNFVQYSLQLNMYRHILQKYYGKTVEEMKLVLIHPENETYKVHDVPVMEAEISRMLETRNPELRPGLKKEAANPAAVPRRRLLCAKPR